MRTLAACSQHNSEYPSCIMPIIPSGPQIIRSVITRSSVGMSEYFVFLSLASLATCLLYTYVVFLFERSEFLIATCKKKKTDRLDVCPDVRIISSF